MFEELGFENAQSIGVLGEALFKKIKERHGCQVIDVSEDPTYWGSDIDFLVRNGAKETTYEIKTDRAMWKWGNLFLESVIEFTDGNSPQFIKGWIRKSKADTLIYIDADIEKIKGRYMLKAVRHFYYCNLPQLLEWVKVNDVTMGLGIHKDTMSKGEHVGRPYIAYGFKGNVNKLKEDGILKEYEICLK